MSALHSLKLMPSRLAGLVAAIAVLTMVAISIPATTAAPLAIVAGPQSYAADDALASPAAARLCGRTLGGRCTKGRAACTKGTAEDCARWTAWSKACTACADAFAKCRDNARYTCASCIKTHNRCESLARVR